MITRTTESCRLVEEGGRLRPQQHMEVWRRDIQLSEDRIELEASRVDWMNVCVSKYSI